LYFSFFHIIDYFFFVKNVWLLNNNRLVEIYLFLNNFWCILRNINWLILFDRLRKLKVIGLNTAMDIYFFIVSYTHIFHLSVSPLRTSFRRIKLLVFIVKQNYRLHIFESFIITRIKFPNSLMNLHCELHVLDFWGGSLQFLFLKLFVLSRLIHISVYLFRIWIL
jgi:hypothetical protein